jgi:hypothetical protein
MSPSQMVDMLTVLFQEQHIFTFYFHYFFPPPPAKVLVAVSLCSQIHFYLALMSYLTSSDSSSRPFQGPVLTEKGYFVAGLYPIRQATVVLLNEQSG